MKTTQTALRDEVHQLAEEAFHMKLISGYGDGQNSDEYQIVWNGKPRELAQNVGCDRSPRWTRLAIECG